MSNPIPSGPLTPQMIEDSVTELKRKVEDLKSSYNPNIISTNTVQSVQKIKQDLNTLLSSINTTLKSDNFVWGTIYLKSLVKDINTNLTSSGNLYIDKASSNTPSDLLKTEIKIVKEFLFNNNTAEITNVLNNQEILPPTFDSSIKPTIQALL